MYVINRWSFVALRSEFSVHTRSLCTELKDQTFSAVRARDTSAPNEDASLVLLVQLQASKKFEGPDRRSKSKLCTYHHHDDYVL